MSEQTRKEVEQEIIARAVANGPIRADDIAREVQVPPYIVGIILASTDRVENCWSDSDGMTCWRGA